MLDSLARRPWTVRAQAALLGRLHRQVHAVPALGWLRAPFGDEAESGGRRRLGDHNLLPPERARLERRLRARADA